jgi:hypothetical protein
MSNNVSLSTNNGHGTNGGMSSNNASVTNNASSSNPHSNGGVPNPNNSSNNASAAAAAAAVASVLKATRVNSGNNSHHTHVGIPGHSTNSASLDEAEINMNCHRRFMPAPRRARSAERFDGMRVAYTSPPGSGKGL